MRHPNKHIHAAVQIALKRGWTLIKSHGHAWGFCGVQAIVLKCRSGRRRGIQSITPGGFANVSTIVPIWREVQPHDQVVEHL